MYHRHFLSNQNSGIDTVVLHDQVQFAVVVQVCCGRVNREFKSCGHDARLKITVTVPSNMLIVPAVLVLSQSAKSIFPSLLKSAAMTYSGSPPTGKLWPC